MTYYDNTLAQTVRRMFERYDNDRLVVMMEQLNDNELSRMVAVCDAALRERNPDPTGFAPPRYEGDQK